MQKLRSDQIVYALWVAREAITKVVLVTWTLDEAMLLADSLKECFGNIRFGFLKVVVCRYLRAGW